MGEVTSEYMCTQFECPCPNNLNISLWENEAENNYWGRTNNILKTNYTFIYEMPLVLS